MNTYIYYTLSQVVTATGLKQESILAEMAARGFKSEVDGLTGQTCFVERECLSAFPHLSGPAVHDLEPMGYSFPILDPRAIEPLVDPTSNERRCATRALRNMLPVFAHFRLEGSFPAGRAEPDDPESFFNYPLMIDTPQKLERVLIHGNYYFRKTIGSGTYVDLRQFVDPMGWASSAEKAWRTAAGLWAKELSTVAGPRAKKVPLWTPPAPKAQQPKYKALPLALFGTGTVRYDPKAPKLFMFGELPGPGDPKTWQKWVPYNYLEAAVDRAHHYADVLQEERLSLRRALTNRDFATSADEMRAFNTGQKATEPLKSEARHRQDFDGMLVEWSRDADAWRGSILQQIFPDNFRLVF